MQAGDRQPELSIRGRAAGMGEDNTYREEDSMQQANPAVGAAPRGPYQGRPPRAPSIRRIGSRELMGPSGQLIIRHAGDDYRLRVTSKGKLILTK
jgi:hemin uptake protein HemP